MIYSHINVTYLFNMSKSIESLFKSISRTEFLDKYISNTPVVVHGDLGEFAELTELPFLESLTKLLDIWPSEVTAYMPGIADEGNSRKVSTDEARELFNNGSGLCFDDANHFSQLLEEWPQSLRADLGLPMLTVSRSLIYAIKEGRGTSAHFDQNINFIIQISGTKKWWISPNVHVENPLSRHTIGLDIDPELASYTESVMPDEMPEDAVEHILTPGSVLFLPRGAWHKTEALSDAVSLNFTFTAPSWIDILSAALRGRLAQSSEWRETADFVNDEQLHPQAIAKFNQLLNELGHEVPHWRAEDILGATEMGNPPTN
jgi:50S ribosomal protein L16 3-hydroxylase